MGLEENSNIVYLIDFGLAKKYRSSKTLEHIPFITNKRLTGNARFASISALKGNEQSRRDDLESICYLFLYFLKGSLPWQGIKIKNKENCYKKVYQRKATTSAEALCFRLPSEFKEFLVYTRNLRFDEDPNYDFLKNLIKSVMISNDFEFDDLYDWKVERKKRENSVKYTEDEFEKEYNYNNIISDNESVHHINKDTASKANNNSEQSDEVNDSVIQNEYVVNKENTPCKLITNLNSRYPNEKMYKSNEDMKSKMIPIVKPVLVSKKTYPQTHRRNIRNNVITFNLRKGEEREGCLIF